MDTWGILHIKGHNRQCIGIRGHIYTTYRGKHLRYWTCFTWWIRVVHVLEDTWGILHVHVLEDAWGILYVLEDTWGILYVLEDTWGVLHVLQDT